MFESPVSSSCNHTVPFSKRIFSEHLNNFYGMVPAVLRRLKEPGCRGHVDRGRKRDWGYAFILSLVILIFAGLLCGFVEPSYPDPVGNVNDYAGVLTSRDKQDLNALIDAVLNQTGTTFAVAIISDHGDESIEMYSVKLYEKWGIGQKNEDKGLLLVVSLKEREARIEVGYGLEGVITDARAGQCLDKMTPFFKQGEYGKGIYEGLLMAAQYVADDAGVKLEINPAGDVPPEDPVYGFPAWTLWLVLPVVLCIPLAILLSMRRNRCPRCKSKLACFDRIIEEATYERSGLATRIYACPVCGYSREKTYKVRPLIRPPGGGGFSPMGGGPFFGGMGGGRSGGGFSSPRGFGGGRSGGGGASRKW